MVADGQIAIIHYTARLATEDAVGEIVDTTDIDVARREGIYHDHRDYKPFEFRIGEGNVIPALEDAVHDLEKPGDSTVVRAEPTEAFGERDPSAVDDLPREALEEVTDATLEPETLVTTDDGRSGWITEVTDDTIVVDFNHELAEKDLEIEVELLDVHGEPGEGHSRNWEKKSGRRK
jgi:peptidylprolyl isomerase